MAYFRVSRTCLKGLLGNVSSRILVENSIVLREGLLGINVYMYLSLEFLFVIVVTVQPLKSNWKGSPVKRSIEEPSRRIWERGRQVGAC
jgi:hypothetical protein